jgi:hypothetical protein
MDHTARVRNLPKKYDDCEVNFTPGRRKRIVVETIVANPGPQLKNVRFHEEERAVVQPPVDIKVEDRIEKEEEEEEHESSSQELVDSHPIPRNSCCFYPRTLLKWLLT